MLRCAGNDFTSEENRRGLANFGCAGSGANDDMSNTTRAIRIHETGAPEVMRWEETPLNGPGLGQVLLRHTFVGLNFIDINHRSGAYPLKSLPAVIGMEAAGVIESTGPGVEGFSEGDRVTYCMVLGSYAERRVISAEHLCRVTVERRADRRRYIKNGDILRMQGPVTICEGIHYV